MYLHRFFPIFLSLFQSSVFLYVYVCSISPFKCISKTKPIRSVARQVWVWPHISSPLTQLLRGKMYDLQVIANHKCPARPPVPQPYDATVVRAATSRWSAGPQWAVLPRPPPSHHRPAPAPAAHHAECNDRLRWRRPVSHLQATLPSFNKYSLKYTSNNNDNN